MPGRGDFSRTSNGCLNQSGNSELPGTTHRAKVQAKDAEKARKTDRRHGKFYTAQREWTQRVLREKDLRPSFRNIATYWCQTFVNRKSWSAYVSQKRLGDETNYSVKTVQRCFIMLAGLGYVHYNGRVNRANEYIFVLPVGSKPEGHEGPMSDVEIGQEGDRHRTGKGGDIGLASPTNHNEPDKPERRSLTDTLSPEPVRDRSPVVKKHIVERWVQKLRRRSDEIANAVNRIRGQDLEDLCLKLEDQMITIEEAHNHILKLGTRKNSS